jgi:hypothetical protein
MTNEERDIISQFIARVGGAPQQSSFSGGSVPATQPALPPVDKDADALIAQQFAQYPEARYRITQLAFVQEHALVEAQNRIKRLEWEVQQAQQAAQQAQQQASSRGSSGGGFFSGLFGGGRQQQPQGGPPPGAGPWGQGPGPQQGYYQQQQGYYQQSAPPPPQYPPGYQQGVFQRQGSGFLGSALTTAAGVAGGLVAGNALMSLFSPHQSAFGGEPGAGIAGAASPWTTPGQGAVDTGSWNQGSANQDYVDSGTWDQPNDQDSSWSDNSGGWDNSGGDWGGGNSDDTF